MSEDRVLLCNHSGDSCQFGSDLLQCWPGSLCSSPGTARDHNFSTYHAVPFFQGPPPGVCISDEGRSAGEEKEAGFASGQGDTGGAASGERGGDIWCWAILRIFTGFF